jgi:hypothetical protein
LARKKLKINILTRQNFAICVFRNRIKKSRALKKLKESLPASPSKRCVVISTYLSRRSPEFPTVLIQDRLFISGYNNVEFGGHARLLFYFLGHTGQIIYFQVFGGQNIYFQKLPEN